MKLNDYLPTTEAFNYVANAQTVGASKYLLKAVSLKRDKERSVVENRPCRDNDNLKNDIIFKLGYIAALNWILDLPGKARDQINNLPEGD